MKIILFKQHGFLSIVAIAIIMLISFIGIAITYMLVSSAAATNNFQQGERALFLAEAGLEHATHELLGYNVINRSACSGLNISNTLGTGNAYNVTSTGPFYTSSATTLNGALTASATTITVTSTTNYQSAGRIMIDKELISYTSKDATHFNGVTRGVDGSTAIAHVSGTRVGQFQCNLTSQGGLPDLTTPLYKRQLQEYIQMQEAWAVGDRVSGNFTLARWNNPTGATWNNVSSTGAFNLSDIVMISYVDGWAVGASTTFIRWNGSTWSTVASGLGGSVYNSICCNASNDCHVVGNTRRFGRWNGTSWVSVSATGSLANTNLQSIYCGTSTDCWAVGSNAGGGKFYHGTGSPIAWVGITESALTVSANTVNSVFCNGTNDCWAVGTGATFAHYNGTAWSNFATGLPAVVYNSVFCNSSSDCWVVGNISGTDMFAHWNGTAWSRDSSNPTPIANLNSVKCIQPNDCWAVGKTNTGTNTAFVHWDGTSWTQFATGTMPASALNAVAIVGPGNQPWSVWSEAFA